MFCLNESINLWWSRSYWILLHYLSSINPVIISEMSKGISKENLEILLGHIRWWGYPTNNWGHQAQFLCPIQRIPSPFKLQTQVKHFSTEWRNVQVKYSPLLQQSIVQLFQSAGPPELFEHQLLQRPFEQHGTAINQINITMTFIFSSTLHIFNKFNCIQLPHHQTDDWYLTRSLMRKPPKVLVMPEQFDPLSRKIQCKVTWFHVK